MKGITKTCSSCSVELYKHLGIFQNTGELREALTKARAFLSTSLVFLKIAAGLLTQQRSRCVFYSLNNPSRDQGII